MRVVAVAPAAVPGDGRGRPPFIGTGFPGSVTRGRLLSPRITNASGPLPDRIFRNGYP